MELAGIKKQGMIIKFLDIWKNSKKIHFSVSQQLQVCRDDNRFFYEYSWVKLKAYRRYFLKLWTMSEISAKIAYEKLWHGKVIIISHC